MTKLRTMTDDGAGDDNRDEDYDRARDVITAGRGRGR